jgi:hypothetical protein
MLQVLKEELIDTHRLLPLVSHNTEMLVKLLLVVEFFYFASC